MSARFGRNQRRRLRAEIAARDAEIKRLEAVNHEHWIERLRHLEARQRTEGEMVEWAARIVAIAGTKSAFARELETVGVDPEYFLKLVDGLPMSLEAPSIESLRPSTAEILTVAKRIVEAFSVYAVAEDDPIRFRTRFEVRDKNGRTALMMDARTLHDLKSRADRQLVRYLMQQLLLPWAKTERPR